MSYILWKSFIRKQPVFQFTAEQEKKQTDALKNKLGDNEFEEETWYFSNISWKQPTYSGKVVRFDYKYFPDRIHGSRKEYDRWAER